MNMMQGEDEPQQQQSPQHAFQPPNNISRAPNSHQLKTSQEEDEDNARPQQRVQFDASPADDVVIPQSNFRPILPSTTTSGNTSNIARTKAVTFRDFPSVQSAESVNNVSQESITTPTLRNTKKSSIATTEENIPEENIDDTGWSYYSNKDGTQMRTSTVSESIASKKTSTLRSAMKRLSSQQTMSSSVIRAPDIDDDLFEHEDIFDNSPYLDASKSYKHMQKTALNKMYGILAVSTSQQKIERGAFSAVILIVLIVTIILSLPNKISIIDKPGTTTVGMFGTIPPFLDWRLANWYAPEDSFKDVAFFWSIPMSGSLLFTDVMGSCLQLVQASEVGVLGNYGEETELKIVEIFGDSFINVDTTTSEGIKRAVSLGLAESDMADVVISPIINDTAYLFNEKHQGRMFAIFRNPIQRSANMFYYFSTAKWDKSYNPALANITLEEYARSNYMENNYLTRLIINKPGGALTESDINMAKEILRRKCLVGLYDKIKESVERFEKYFGWTDSGGKDADECITRVLSQGTRKYDVAPIIKEGTEEYDMLYQQNRFDMELYFFVKQLYSFQELE